MYYCPFHFILLDLITRIIFVEEYKPFSSSVCSLLRFPVTPSLLGPNIFLSTLTVTLSAYVPTSTSLAKQGRNPVFHLEIPKWVF
jgi:hypothetical protein